MTWTIREARVEDLDAINDIYNECVANSTATYDLVPTTRAQRWQWWREHEGRFPVLVAERKSEVCTTPIEVRTTPIVKPISETGRGGEVIGWASLSEFRSRPAYRFTVENSVYLRPDARGQGLGKAIMIELLSRIEPGQYHSIIAGVSADQEASVRLHRSLGFVEVAHLREVGFKFGRWLDVVYLQKML